MDPNEFQRLLQNVSPAPAQAGQEGGMELDTEALASMAEQVGITLPEQAPIPEQSVRRDDGTDVTQMPAGPEQGLGDASGLDALAGGALKGVFETKDFLFGDTAPEDRSEFRANVEDTVDSRKAQSIVDGFSAGIGQFAIGMIGLGKARWATKALPWVGAGLTALSGSKVGVASLEAAKAATVGAIAFDPHEERLSNLIQGTPLANPINAWLAADPTDSAAEGRVKAALESIGLDGAILGTFMASTKIWKALRTGKVDDAAALADELDAEVARASEEEDFTDAATPKQAASGQPLPGEAAGNDAVPTVPEEGAAGSGSGAVPSEASSPELDDGANGASPQQVAEDTGIEVSVTSSTPEVVATPTEAAQQADTTLTTVKDNVRFSDEDTATVLAGMEADADALTKHGGWYQALEAGHTFGKGEGIPYVKLNSDAAVDDFMARVVDASAERLDNLKGGKVLSDERVGRLVDQRVALFDEDPALLLGTIQKAGKDATHAVAEMEAGYLVSARMFQDTYALASRIKMGDYAEFGGKQAAMDALKQRLSLAASIYGSARSITAASGRAVRRMRSEFKLDPKAIAGLKELDGDQLAELLVNTQGNPRNLARMANPTFWTKAVDFGQFLLINNLVSGPKTQLINLVTNSYMVGARPMERILGSSIGAFKGDIRSRAILQESVKQYAYLGTALGESFELARKAFMLNDSILSPHRSEMWRGAQSGAKNAMVTDWKPWDGIGNVLHNAMRVATNTVGIPTRVLGTVDELVKQTVYRSKVLARAHMQAVQEGAQSGLSGKPLDAFVKSFIRDKLDKAFDMEGRGVDPEALREANIATFQQELLPGTIGKTVNTAVANHPGLRLILPFVKTPTNVLRYGWKMAPGLNALQTEYRDMWTGRLGKEAQAQAYGQMAMGTMFMGYAAYMVSQGTITGGGPSDPKLNAELRSTGWQPYSRVIENEDGTKTYVPFSRFDPIAMPFGIIADLQDAIVALGDEEDEQTVNERIGSAMGALGIGLAKQFTSKTYLQGISQAMDALTEPDTNAVRVGGQMLSNFIPYSAAQRQLNPDPYLREARDVTDKVLATIPGLSEKVPPRRDAWGDPVLTRKGLWTSDEDSVVDREVQRLAIESGSSITRPQPVHNGVDLRDLIMSDGRNAYDVYQQLAGRPHPKAVPLKRRVGRMVESERYKKAPDGEAGVKGTKLWLLHDLTSKYRSAAMKRLKRDAVVREAFLKETKRVREAYIAARPTQPATPKPSLGEVGKSFGVDLDALMGPVQK